MSRPKMLVTGFAPYREARNASGELVASLAAALPDALRPLQDRLVFEVIRCDDTTRETEHASLESQLAGLLSQHRPDVCLFTGQAPPYNKIVIEKIATNAFLQEIIDPARPVAYWADLPGLEGLKDMLEAHGIPAAYSFYGGQHLCNHILYSSLYFAQRHALPHRSGFIHIPLLPEQVIGPHRESPFMPLDMTRQALSRILLHVAAAFVQ